MVIGELIITFHENGTIVFNDDAAQEVSIGQIVKAGKKLASLDRLIRPEDIEPGVDE